MCPRTRQEARAVIGPRELAAQALPQGYSRFALVRGVPWGLLPRKAPQLRIDTGRGFRGHQLENL